MGKRRNVDEPDDAYQLVEVLHKYNRWLRVLVEIDGRCHPIEVTWSAVDPSLGLPETVIIRKREDTSGQ